MVSERLNVDPNSLRMYYTSKFDQSMLVLLDDYEEIKKCFDSMTCFIVCMHLKQKLLWIVQAYLQGILIYIHCCELDIMIIESKVVYPCSKVYPWLVNRDPRLIVSPLVSHSPVINASVVGEPISDSPIVAFNFEHVQRNITTFIHFIIDVLTNGPILQSHSASNRGNGSYVNQHKSMQILRRR